MSPSNLHTTNPASKKNFLFPSIAGIIFIVIILLLVIFFPCPTSSQFVVFRIVLSIAIAGFAAVIPGFFSFKYKTVVSAGGAIAVFAFTYLFNPTLINTEDKCNEPVDFTFFLEDSTGVNPLKSSGKLILLVENDKREELIDGEGSASFKRLPFDMLGKTARVQLEADGWQFANTKNVTELKLEGRSAQLIIRRDNSFCCVSGSIRDNSNRFLEGVKVSINNTFDETDANGSFSITIPLSEQLEEQRLTAYKPGYVIWEDKVYPATRKHVSIIMTPQK